MGSPLPQRSASGGESAGADWAVGDRAHCGAHLGLGTVRFIGECLELGGTETAAGGFAAEPANIGLKVIHMETFFIDIFFD